LTTQQKSLHDSKNFNFIEVVLESLPICHSFEPINRKCPLNSEEHQVGETRIVDGLVSMCLGYRSYGGGSGFLWAKPAEQVEFSIRGTHSGYYKGICQGVFPKNKSVSLLIVQGNTWGDFKTGNVVEIKAEYIGRYDQINRFADEDLVAMAKRVEEDTFQSELFQEISRSELQDVYKKEFKEASKHFLGEKAYEKSEEIFEAYKSFIENIRHSKSDLYRQPSKKILSSARRIRILLGLDGKQPNLTSNNLIHTNMGQSESAAYGAVCGALAGDAAGGVLEFIGKKPSRSDVDYALNMPGGGVFKLAPGQITDDGELTLCLLRALADRDGKYDANLVARYYIDWANSNPFDMGIATGNALRVHGYELGEAAKIVFKAAGDSNKGSKANGALMRITPLAVASVNYSKEDAVQFAKVDSRMTHPHVTCGEVNAAYVLAIRHLILNPGDSEGAVASAYSYLQSTTNEAAEWMENAIDGDLPDAHPQAGYVRIAFTYAFYHLKQRSSFRAALSDTLARGGDTDTNACIVGGLIGAYRGINKLIESEVTRKLIYPVLMCDPSFGQKRPEVYHAGNAPNWLSALFSSSHRA
jgi:ADP-ribosylglycohydrolase